MTETKEILRGKKIGVVGSGNMGRALILGMKRSGLVSPSDLIASDVDAAQRKALGDAAHVLTVAKNSILVEASDVVVLAVKPKDMKRALQEIGSLIKPDRLVISIAAGITLETLQKNLDKNPVVRAMPNTPALVGKGMAAICAGKRANSSHMHLARSILGCVGDVVEVPETWMDAVTATSGSGPAYVFYFIEALIEGAIALGIGPEIAKKLVIETFVGSLELLKTSGESPEVLRRRVTSPGGTTEAALRFLDDREIKKILAGALQAAAKRGKELSNNG